MFSLITLLFNQNYIFFPKKINYDRSIDVSVFLTITSWAFFWKFEGDHWELQEKHNLHQNFASDFVKIPVKIAFGHLHRCADDCQALMRELLSYVHILKTTSVFYVYESNILRL